MPASLLPAEQSQEPVDVIPALSKWVRSTLVLITVGLIAVFGIAAWLRPYDDAGQALLMQTHRQLGLPPCTFYDKTGLPCPSCGMTTSFSLLMHGALWSSLRANAVGTLLAAFCLALIPWNLACAVRGRLYFILSLERALTRFVIAFLVLMLARWLIVLGLIWLNGSLVPRLWPKAVTPPADSRRREDVGYPRALAATRPDLAGHSLRRLQHHHLALVPHRAHPRNRQQVAAPTHEADCG